MTGPMKGDMMVRHSIEIPPEKTIELQDTQPLSVVRLVSGTGLLTLRQVRERCGLNQVQLARAAGGRPAVVDWCERGRAVTSAETVQILAALARSFEEMPAHSTYVSWKGERP